MQPCGAAVTCGDFVKIPDEICSIRVDGIRVTAAGGAGEAQSGPVSDSLSYFRLAVEDGERSTIVMNF